MTTALVTHPACEAHLAGRGHPDAPERLNAIRDALIRERLWDFIREEEAPEVTRDELERVHTPEHIRRILTELPGEDPKWIDGDTMMDRATPKAALRAAGSVVHATRLVLSGEVENAFCSIRPPGHHAGRDSAMGFCFFNNIAAGVAEALENHHLNRVAIVDFDAHHGNGTEEIFTRDSRVLLCSVFQEGLYPGAEGKPAGTRVVNVALPPGSDGSSLREAVLQEWEEPIANFQPEMIFISAGFDGHRDDAMSHLLLNESDYAWLTGFIMEKARKHARGRVVSALEGGYDPVSLGNSVATHVKTLMGI